MTNNQITVAVERIRGKVTPTHLQSLRESMREAEDGCMDVIMAMPLKSKGVALALALHLGRVGAGRFYVGDKGIAIGRIIMSVLTGVLSFVPILGFILAIASLIWIIVDSVLVFRRVSEKNYLELTGYLAQHKKKAEAQND